jgi:uncharacterized protein (DUF362 family)
MTSKDKTTVAVVRGPERYQNIRQVLGLLGGKATVGAKHVVKPNFVSTQDQLAATHRETARAVVDFIRQHTGRPVVVAEGAATSDTFEGYKNFGFTELWGTHEDVELRDLNRDTSQVVTLYDQDLRPTRFRIAKTVWDSDHRVSVAIPKTHDSAVVTLSLKNMVVGSLIRDMGHNLINLVGGVSDRLLRLVPSWMKPVFTFQGLSRVGITKISGSDKVKLHQGYLNLHLFLYQLVRMIPGPVSGDPINWHVAVAGTDGVAVDTVTAYLMGFDPKSIGYLHFCSQDGLGQGDMNNIKIIGTPLEKCMHSFRPHQSYGAQLSWEKGGEAAFKKLKVYLNN